MQSTELRVCRPQKVEGGIISTVREALDSESVVSHRPLPMTLHIGAGRLCNIFLPPDLPYYWLLALPSVGILGLMLG